jgi:hypothetical protein
MEILDDDLEVISYLVSSGLNFFEKFPHVLDSPTAEKYVKYFDLYLTSDMFDKSIESFVQYIIYHNNNSYIWSKYVENSTFEQISNILDQILSSDYLCCISLVQTYMLFNVLMSHPIVLKKLDTENEKSFVTTIDILFKKSTYSVEDTTWIYKYLENIFTQNKKTKKVFVKTVAHLLNNNIPKINLDTYSFKNQDLVSDKYLASIYTVLMQLFQKGGASYIHKIDQNYIVKDGCPINWYDVDKSLVDKSDSVKQNFSEFYTELFFLILDCHRILITPMLNRTTEWNKFKKEIEIQIAPYKGMNIAMPTDLQKEYDYILSVLEETDEIKKSNIIGSSSEFYYVVCRWINECNPTILLDPILDDMIGFLIHVAFDETNNDDLLVVNKIFDIAILVITGDITKNINLKFQYLRYIDANLSSLTKDTNDIMRLMDGIIDILLALNKIPSVFMYRFSYKLNIYNFIDNLCIHCPRYKYFSNCMNHQLLIDKLKSRAFINMIVDDINELHAFISTQLSSMKKNTMANMFGNINIMVYEVVYQVYTMIHFVNNMMSLSKFKQLICSDELISAVATLINGIASIIVNDLNISLDFVPPTYLAKTKLKMNIIDLVSELHMLCKTVSANDRLVEKMISEELVFRIDIFETISMLAGDGDDFINLLIKKSDEIKQIQYSEEIPDEFLDPITFRPIEHPILLPYMTDFDDIYHDQSTIIRSLLKKEENPYNRHVLTIEELNKYNKEPEVVKKIINFVDKFETWKQLHKK